MGRVWVSVGAFALLAGVASAQSRASFKDIQGFKNVLITSTGLTTSITVGPDAAIIDAAGNSHELDGIDGFWYLNNTTDFSGAVNVDLGDWRTKNNNAGAGGIFGWETNPTMALGAGQTFAFTATSLDLSQVDQLGFNVKADGGVPTYVTFAQPVPEPGTLCGLGLGALALLRKRKRK